MGTRGRYGFCYKGRHIFFYNHFDSYCDGLGQLILNELANISEEDFAALKAILKQHLRNRTLTEGMDSHEGNDYEGLMKAAQHPEEYSLLYVGQPIPYPTLDIEYTYIVDLDVNFLRVHTRYDKFKFPLHQLPPYMGPYDEQFEFVDTNLSDVEEAE